MHEHSIPGKIEARLSAFLCLATTDILSHNVGVFLSCKARCLNMGLLDKLRNLNLFVRHGTQDSNDTQLVNDQVFATRLYLILLLTAIVVIILFNMLRPILVTETGSNPSFDTYLKLEAAHERSLFCQCRQPTVQYIRFFSLKAVYHEVSYHTSNAA